MPDWARKTACQFDLNYVFDPPILVELANETS